MSNIERYLMGELRLDLEIYLRGKYTIRKSQKAIKEMSSRLTNVNNKFLNLNNFQSDYNFNQEYFNIDLILKEIDNKRNIITQEILLFITIIKQFSIDYFEIKDFILSKGLEPIYEKNKTLNAIHNITTKNLKTLQNLNDDKNKKKIEEDEEDDKDEGDKNKKLNTIVKNNFMFGKYNTTLSNLKKTTIIREIDFNGEKHLELNHLLIPFLIKYVFEKFDVKNLNYYNNILKSKRYKELDKKINYKGKLLSQFKKTEIATITQPEIQRVLNIRQKYKQINEKIERFIYLKDHIDYEFLNYILDNTYSNYLKFIFDNQIRKELVKKDNFTYIKTYEDFILSIGEEYTSLTSTLYFLKNYQGNYKKLIENFIKDLDSNRFKEDIDEDFFNPKKEFDKYHNIITYSQRNKYHFIPDYETYYGEYTLLKNMLHEGCYYYKKSWVSKNVLNSVFDFFELCGLYYYLSNLSMTKYPNYLEKE